ncbi:MAG: 3-phosphoserine/phosphohydroxythreonine transaminase [Xanthomonadales bacterium PRO6]|nr:Phosphoserine aminotransferase [Xanthomonadales bacterium]MCE7930546.1 3-phosphoserine/phosphohydroxythreonine transaminase [Xanthomonadales bacterium PRO6]
MSRAFNFSAGPGALPEPVLRQAQQEMLEWRDARASVMEISHRDKAFIALAESAEASLREILAIPSNYKVLFLQGGATAQFALLPMNLAAPDQAADYVLTGAWSEKAAKEAETLCTAKVAASSADANFTTVPDVAGWTLSEGAAYLHVTPNETIHGVEFYELPERSAPVIADVSSTILSRPLDVSKYGVLYAGAQKNIGPSGITVMIVREDLLERKPRALPQILSYKAHAENQSMLNTPPTFGWYVAALVFDWVKAQGGLAAIGERNRRKAEKLYAAIDGSGGFYTNQVDPRYRSWMNVPFVLPDEKLDAPFLKGAEAAGMLGLKGHRAVGGMRASIYNATGEAAVDVLIEYMREFQRKNG